MLTPPPVDAATLDETGFSFDMGKQVSPDAEQSGEHTDEHAADDSGGETTFGTPPSESADATMLGAPTDEQRDETTFEPPDGATVLGPPADGETVLGPTGDGETVLGPPPEGETVLGPPSSAVSPPSSSRRPAPVAPAASGTRPAPGATAARAKAAAPGDGPLAVGEAFGSRYHIIRLLGAGGMGAVYQAWDAELGVAVAIKVVRPDITADATAAAEVERRFKRELLLARQVTHPNVVRIHDLGEIDGIKYITMQYVEGSDLATILKKHGKLSVQVSLRLARQVASGLLAAHEANIVHRDLKPANIAVEQDRAMIMDFGIARSGANVPAGPDTARGLGSLAGLKPVQQAATVAGAVVGTLEYMAPEQARAQHVDHRADIYAFGLILSDMLVGRQTASAARGAIEALRERIEKAPPPIRSVDPKIPEAIEQIITKCVQPDPALRYQTTAELVADLDRLDENGIPIPVKRVVGLRMTAAIVVLLLALSGAAFWYFRPPPAPVKHDPVSVLIADVENKTADQVFDRTVEPVLKLALEDAEFISAFDRGGMRALGITKQPEKLDERSAQEIAVRQGVGVVLAGVLEPRGSGYSLTVKAMQAVTGNLITTATARASNKTEVLSAATDLAADIRKALGDASSDDAAQRFAKDTLSATSLDAVRDYAVGQQALSDNRNEDAIESYLKAISKDPNFAVAYTGLAWASRNMGRQQDATKYAQEALRHLDSMTAREKYRARGLFYYVTNDYGQCVKEYTDLLDKFAGDAVAGNNRALCLSNLRKNTEARDEMKRVVSILPKRALYRINLSLYASYGTDFETGEASAREAQTLSATAEYGFIALAFAQLGQNKLAEAADTYQKLSKVSVLGASLASSGLADMALYEGRLNDAATMLEQGAAADLAAKNKDRAALKLAQLANARLLQNKHRAAIAAAERALENSDSVNIRFLAARVLVEAGDPARAKALAATLASELQPAPQALAKILDGELALKNKDPRQAIKVLTEANGLLDTWIARFDLGRAYLDAGAFPQADSEFDRCITRRGEALALFLDEEPSYGYMPPVYYYQGRVRQSMKSEKFAESYRTYLSIREKAGEDPLLPDVRKRAGS